MDGGSNGPDVRAAGMLIRSAQRRNLLALDAEFARYGDPHR